MAEKTIVLTMYGKNDNVEYISISLFDKNEPYYPSAEAKNYCENINALELNDGQWVYARIIDENKKIELERPMEFAIINKLNDKSVQRVLNETSGTDLTRALIGADEATREKIFRNISKRAAVMLNEDMKTLREIKENEIKTSQNKMLEIIKHLAETGELIVNSTL